MILVAALLSIMGACGEYKQVLPGTKLYKYVNNQSTPERGKDKIVEYRVTEKFTSKIADKTSRYEIVTVPVANISAIDSTEVDGKEVAPYMGTENIYYSSENRKFLSGKQFEPGNFLFYYGKFSQTGLTIPLKYRKGVGDEALNPPTLETGFNVNFAPSYRLNWSSFNSYRKFLGANLTNYSVTIGGLLGIGGTDLKTKTNSPGLLSDRKSTTLTYGGTLILGLNSFGIGYAVGFDNVLGSGSKYWVYQNKIWHGIVVSVDLIK